MEEKLVELLRELTHVFGCSGREEMVCRAIQKHLPLETGKMVVRRDGLGNLLVQTGTRGGPRLMLDAHMDSIGIMLTDISKPDRMKFRAIGFLRPETMLGISVVFEDGRQAAIASDSSSPKSVGELFARPKKANTEFRVGDTAVFKPNFFASDGFASGTFLDNRVNCAVLLTAVEDMLDSPNEVWCCFSTQEEVGMRGAAVAARQIQPDMAFAMDMGIAKPGRGIIEKMMDDSIVCAPAALQMLEAAVQIAGASCVRAVGGAGYTNAGEIHIASRGCPTAILGIPGENLHSPMERACIADMLASRSVLIQIANTKLEGYG